MGRALLIMCAGFIVALSYTFIGMSTRGLSMTERNVNSFNELNAKNTAHSGINLAIRKYGESNGVWTGPETVTWEGAELAISIEEIKTDTIRVISESSYSGAQHRVEAAYDISQNQSLLPDFVTALSVANGTFGFSMGGSSSINGRDASGQCADRAGVTVPNASGVSTVGEHSGIDGNPDDVATIDTSIDYQKVSELIAALAPKAKHISGNYKGGLGTAENPQVTFVDSYTKLTGGIDPGHGILVIRSGGELELEGELFVAGNLIFNGLVIFENAYKFTGRGTPNINGSVIVGYSGPYGSTDIDVNGDIHIQYDCEKKKYADKAVSNLMNTTYFQQISLYE